MRENTILAERLIVNGYLIDIAVEKEVPVTFGRARANAQGIEFILGKNSGALGGEHAIDVKEKVRAVVRTDKMGIRVWNHRRTLQREPAGRRRSHATPELPGIARLRIKDITTLRAIRAGHDRRTVISRAAGDFRP